LGGDSLPDQGHKEKRIQDWVRKQPFRLVAARGLRRGDRGGCGARGAKRCGNLVLKLKKGGCGEPKNRREGGQGEERRRVQLGLTDLVQRKEEDRRRHYFGGT